MLSIIFVFVALFLVSRCCLHVHNKWFDGRNHNDIEVERCVVCLNEIDSKGEKLRLLPTCGHCFHARCIDAWLKVGTTCPLCRVNVVPKRNVLVSSVVCLAKRVGKWIEDPLSSELTLAFCETLGYV